MRKLSRKEAEEKMEAIFSALHYNLMDAMNAGGERTGEESYFHAEAWKVDQGRQKEDYRQTVMSLDSVGFKEYYKLVGQFATAYKIGCWKEYSECEPILIEELGEELGRCEKTKEKLELINSFTAEELHSQTFSFDAKIKVLQDILDDFSVGNEKEEVINKLLASFSGKDSSAFIARLQSDGKLLNGLLGRVNGGEKDRMLALLYQMLSDSERTRAEEYKVPSGAGFDAKYKNGKVEITTYLYLDRKISRYKYKYIDRNRELEPFTNVTFCYGSEGNEITVPAIVLVKSRGDGVLYDELYKSNIEWNGLCQDEKKSLYTEFVLHYLPKELLEAAVGDPMTFVIMCIVALAIAYAGQVVAACGALVGAAMSARDVVAGCELITSATAGYGSVTSIQEAKKSAQSLAKGLALIGVEVIPALLGLAKRGVARYNGREIRVGKAPEDLPRKKPETGASVGSGDGPPTSSGQWKTVNESMSDFSRAYQKQITGQEGMAWIQNGVKFDGMKDGVLLDAKGKYAQFINKNTGEFYGWFIGKESLLDEAARQIKASEGAKIQWYFAEKEVCDVVQDLFMDKGITEIELIFQAPK